MERVPVHPYGGIPQAWRGRVHALVCIGAVLASAWFGPLAPLAAHAQSINPGAVESESRRQQERFEQQTQPPKQPGPAVVGPARQQSPLLRPGGPKFLLKAVEFDQSKFLSKAELDAIAAQYVGKRIDFSALLQMLAAINELYQQKGVITGIATLPPQKVDGGVVRVQLTEGRLGRSSIEGNVQTSRHYIRDRVRLPREGEVVDVPQLSRDVTWFNRTNDVQIRALLQRGSTFGLTDVQLAVTEPAINTLQFFVDNQGVKTTGRYQSGTYYRHHGWLGMDDRFTFYGVGAEGNLNGNVSYTVPINPFGGRLGASYTQGRIKIVDGPFATLDVTGQSMIGALNFSQPIWADRNWLLLANLAGSYGRSETDFSDVTVTDDRTRKVTYGFAVSHFTDFSSVTVAPAVNRATVHNAILDTDRSFQTYTGTVSGYTKFPFLPEQFKDFSFSLLGSWQYTNEDLLTGDQLFQIGGPTTVRGFPTNVVAGDKGYYLNLELHYNMGAFVKGLDLYAFRDSGAVYSTFPAVTRLNSIGAGLSWTIAAPLTFEASIGKPLNEVVTNQPERELYGRIVFRPLLFK